MIRFYGAPMSSAGRCHWLLEELGLPHEYILVNPSDGSTRKSEYLRLNGTGKVPAIDDDGFVLFESLAINNYLAEKHRAELLGKDLQERALVQQWSLWALTNLQPHPLNVMLHGFLLPEPKRDAASARASAERALPLLRQLDEAVMGKQFLVGDRFTVADINVASVAVLTKACGLLQPFERVNAWLGGLAARPAFAKAFPS